MSESSGRGCGGVGFFGLMFLIFLTLKLCGVIDWSWWFVTAPLWGPWVLLCLFIIASIVAVALFSGICAIIVAAMEMWESKQKKR